MSYIITSTCFVLKMLMTIFTFRGPCMVEPQGAFLLQLKIVRLDHGGFLYVCVALLELARQPGVDECV